MLTSSSPATPVIRKMMATVTPSTTRQKIAIMHLSVYIPRMISRINCFAFFRVKWISSRSSCNDHITEKDQNRNTKKKESERESMTPCIDFFYFVCQPPPPPPPPPSRPSPPPPSPLLVVEDLPELLPFFGFVIPSFLLCPLQSVWYLRPYAPFYSDGGHHHQSSCNHLPSVVDYLRRLKLQDSKSPKIAGPVTCWRAHPEFRLLIAPEINHTKTSKMIDGTSRRTLQPELSAMVAPSLENA